MGELVAGVRSSLPSGVDLSEAEWWPRHRVILVLLALHLPVLALAGVRTGATLGHLVPELAAIAGATLVALHGDLPRRLRALAATVGLVACSAFVVHVSGGAIEAHFHFFVVVAVVLLYHDWAVFLAAFGFVLVHHGVLGVLAPETVYNHPDALARPLRWAAIHASAIAATSAAGLVNWHFNERQRARADAYAGSLRHAYEDLRRAADAKDELLSRVSHELRTPLTIVNGFSEALLRCDATMDDDAREESVRAIARNASRLGRLIDHLLAVGDDGRHVARARPVDVSLRALLADAVGSAGDRSGLRPDVVVGGGTTLHVDRGQLATVLRCLLENAARYGEPPVTVTARRLPAGTVEVTVDDGGRGVPDAFVPKLFQRFEQASTGDRRDASGMGLGLYLARTLVEANGGVATYEPGPTGGSRFVLRLPGARDRASVTVDRSPAAGTSARDRATPAPAFDRAGG